ncbi:MAG: pyrimidine/purine nucleosidase domain-containing protein, partial [Glaciecola sp.]
MPKKVQLNPVGWMSQLSRAEMESVTAIHNPERYQLFRKCCLAVLNSG